MIKSKIPDHELARRRIGLQIAEYVETVCNDPDREFDVDEAGKYIAGMIPRTRDEALADDEAISRMLNETPPVASRPSILEPLRKALGIKSGEGSMMQIVAAATERINLHDGMFDAVEAMVDNAKTDRFDSDQMQAVYEAYKALLDAIESGEMPVNKQVAELQAELAKWPRVYWHSDNPKSIEEGYRVLSISGMADCDCDKSWMEVYVDNPSYDGNPFAAPADFGLYSSIEDAKAARDKNK